MEETLDAEIILGLIVLALIPAAYLFACYVLYRVGRKFGIGSFGAFCVPIYNVVLICRAAGISGWFAAATVAYLASFAVPELTPLMYLVLTAVNVYIWGKIAERLGKNFWGWGLGSAIIGIPVLFLAFGSAMPVDGRRPAPPEPEIYDARFDEDDDTVYAPVPAGGDDDAPYRVRIVTGQYAGSELDLPADGLVVGRDPDLAHVILEAPAISGQHVRLTADENGGGLVVTDLGSRNGTYVREGRAGWKQVLGSHRVPRGTPCRVRLGDGLAEFEIS